jgi:hypothetical protein
LRFGEVSELCDQVLVNPVNHAASCVEMGSVLVKPGRRAALGRRVTLLDLVILLGEQSSSGF